MRPQRIKFIQESIGAVPDGIIGGETLTKFAAHFKAGRPQTVHFFATVHHESGGFTLVRENMNYTAQRILHIFGTGRHSAKVTPAEAPVLAGDGPALAERVYGLGNPVKARELGNTRPGDGWLFRGGGAIQITGGANYRRYGSEELYRDPELVGNSLYYFTTSVNYFELNNIWRLGPDLSEGSIRAVCRAVNGGLNGLDDRRRLTNYYNTIWG